MAIVKSKNKKTGITYVYESESYWDPEKKQPRNRRKLIGKLDDEGNIIPTGSRGRKRKEAPEPDERMEELETQVALLQEKARKLEKDKSQLAAGIKELLERYQ